MHQIEGLENNPSSTYCPARTGGGIYNLFVSQHRDEAIQRTGKSVRISRIRVLIICVVGWVTRTVSAAVNSE